MTKALTPAENSKKQSDNLKHATKHFDKTMIVDRFRVVTTAPIGVVKPIYRIQTFPLIAKAV